MSRMLALCAAAVVTAAVAMTSPAGAAERQDQRQDQPRDHGLRNAGQIEVSAARRHHRRYHRRYYGHRSYGRPYYGPRYYYGNPYYYGPRYYRPAPWPFWPFFGPF